MRPAVQRAKEAMPQGTEPYAAMVELLIHRIELHRDALEQDESEIHRGRILECRELLAILRPNTKPPRSSPPADY